MRSEPVHGHMKRATFGIGTGSDPAAVRNHPRNASLLLIALARVKAAAGPGGQDRRAIGGEAESRKDNRQARERCLSNIAWESFPDPPMLDERVGGLFTREYFWQKATGEKGKENCAGSEVRTGKRPKPEGLAPASPLCSLSAYRQLSRIFCLFRRGPDKSCEKFRKEKAQETRLDNQRTEPYEETAGSML